MRDEGQTFEEWVEQARALVKGIGDHAYYSIVQLLALRGDRETLEKSLILTRGDSFERSFSASVLGSLGESNRVFSTEIIEVLLQMLAVEDHYEAIASIIAALGHQENDERIPLALQRYLDHPEEDVRWHLAIRLGNYATPEAAEMLMILTADESPHVRNWATFSLGKQENMDSPEIRAALVARLDDEDVETRAEAFYALAERKDTRVVKALLKEFDEEAHSAPFDSLTDSLDYRLLPALYEMQKETNNSGDARELKEAIAKCEAHLKQYEHEN